MADLLPADQAPARRRREFGNVSDDLADIDDSGDDVFPKPVMKS